MITKQVSMGTIRFAAACAHECNRVYCQSTGDNSQTTWEYAPTWQKDSAIEGVQNILSGKVTSPGDSHEGWRQRKLIEGWVYGPVKDPAKKEHPCMVPFHELSQDQQFKDRLFLCIVRAILIELR